jgi:phage N-6-adenine-methyltransferase
MSHNSIHNHKTNNDNWETPKSVFNAINTALSGKIVMDVAASEQNKKCPIFAGEDRNSLKIEWNCAPGYWFCNPPFSQKVEFIQKANKEVEKGNYGVMILPSDTSTEWFQHYILDSDYLLLFTKRIEFGASPERIKMIQDMNTTDGGNRKESPGNSKGSVFVFFTRIDHEHEIKEVRHNCTLNRHWGKFV